METTKITPKEFTDSLGLTYTAVFVPWSKSRNAKEKEPSLNWKITLTKGAVSLTTDYMEGIGHIPGYQYSDTKSVDGHNAVRRTCETGRNYIWRDCKPLRVPDLTDVLSCLVLDSDVLNHPHFEEWADNYGYDPDSRKAEKIYHECIQTALQLRQLIDIDKATEVFADY